MIRVAWLSLALIFLSASALAQVGAPLTVDIPLRERPGSSGFHNFIRVAVGGGRAGDMLLDTGSPGLRIRAEALGPDVRLTDTPIRFSYSSGNVVSGVLGYAIVAFPDAMGLATPRPIAIHVVQSITCSPEVPRCPGWRPTQIGVMGVAYDATPAFNPLAQLAGNLKTGFIVVANDIADPKVRPHLEVGLTPQNSAGFARTRFAPLSGQLDGLPAWNTKSIRTCFSVDGGPPGCDVTVFDTGASVGSFEPPGLDRDLLLSPVPRGAKVTTEVPGVMRLTVEAGGTLWLNHYRYEPPHGQVLGFNSGGLVFRHYRVLYDPGAGEIGFSPSP